MSMIRNFALIALSVLAFQSVSHAETPAGKQAGHFVLTEVNSKDVSIKAGNGSGLGVHSKSVPTPRVDEKAVNCLASNIYHESRGEPEEGKIAVGMVTINRTTDKRFPSTVCGVVNQRTGARSHSKCQFSWSCQGMRSPHKDDRVWLECQRIARNLLIEPALYRQLRQKYEHALYFHEVHTRPVWTHGKIQLARIGGHYFYRDRTVNT